MPKSAAMALNESAMQPKPIMMRSLATIAMVRARCIGGKTRARESEWGSDRLDERVLLLAGAELDIALGGNVAAVQHRGIVAESLAVHARAAPLDQPARFALRTGKTAAVEQVDSGNAAAEIGAGDLDAR